MRILVAAPRRDMSRPILSADDVRAARRRGELRLAVPDQAIVTPLARDEADRWGIELVTADRSPPESPDGTAPAATCDPDELERIVERVRALVPRADTAQVREIARRVLDRLEP